MSGCFPIKHYHIEHREYRYNDIYYVFYVPMWFNILQAIRQPLLQNRKEIPVQYFSAFHR